MACPWAKIEKPETVNFEDIMSEEVARDLQAKEDSKVFPGPSRIKNDSIDEDTVPDIPEEILKAISNDESYSNDAMIAQMLQIQFDKEYDGELKRIERQCNGSSKVSISFANYRRTPLNDDFESDPEEDEVVDILDRKDWDRFDPMARAISSMPARGYKMQDGKIITKHDTVMDGMKNACKLLSFPPEFHTGDGENIDLKLSNKVFNSLKMHSKHEQSRRYKIRDKREDQATAEFGLDEYTRLLLYKMINKQLLEHINGVISIGKEAVILHAETDPAFPEASEDFPKECAIKVFKTTLSEFKQRDKYIKDDHRFKERFGRNAASRKMVQLWAEKEMANLTRLKRAGIPCPTVVTLKQHVLVMSFIGKDNKPAPKLKDVGKNFEDFVDAYDQVINQMKALYQKANLIHADLSEYNILWHDEQCYFIDVSQAVEPRHENAYHFLFRDCTNITNFFNKKGVPEVMTPEELFKYITGFDFGYKLALAEVRESLKMKPHLMDRQEVELSHDFETIWRKTATGDVPTAEKIVPSMDVSLIEPPKA